MRTIVDISKEDIQALDVLGKKHDLSRAELIRRAVDLYLSETKKKTSGEIVDDIFGAVAPGDPAYWDGLDGTGWQEKMRAEWDDREAMYGRWGFHEEPHPEPDFKIPDVIIPKKPGDE